MLTLIKIEKMIIECERKYQSMQDEELLTVENIFKQFLSEKESIFKFIAMTISEGEEIVQRARLNVKKFRSSLERFIIL